MALKTDGASVGSLAPDFILAGSSGQIRLSDYLGKQNVVLYFMREFSCSWCQKHIAQLKQMYSALQSRNTAVLCICRGGREEGGQLPQKLEVTLPHSPHLRRRRDHRHRPAEGPVRPP